MNTMVELRSVTKKFGDFTAVREVDLSIRAGEFLTLLGPSGCGKTTLLRMISGFETPSSGRVILDAQDVTFVPPYRRNVNQVFQSYALFPHLSVQDNIAFGLQMQKLASGEIKRRVGEVIEMVALGGLEQRRPMQLSGGQRQRVALARAIVCRPKVLLLDEPLSALDAKLRAQMQVELKRLQQRLGMTFVFVTHDQEEALVMSDRVAVINRGRLEQIGDASEIYHQPLTQFVAEFIGEANIVESRVVYRNGSSARVRLADGVELAVRSVAVGGDGDEVLVSIRPEKIRLQRTRPEGDNVFEAFVEEELFRGATDQLLVRTDSGLELTVVVANESAIEDAFHRGDRLYCHLHPDDVVVIKRVLSEARSGIA